MNRLLVERKVLGENDRIALELRKRFRAQGTLCLNLISAPGSGKTSLLESTLRDCRPQDRVAVLTGDIQTDNDASRLRRFGFPVKQITTGGTCHLDARMVERALADWPGHNLEILFIENVGNLVCPASYDLGEAAKIALLSVTEGDDKPLKYPSIFFRSSLMLITKLDLLPYVPFDLAEAEKNARRVHPGIEIRGISTVTGEGVREWRLWIEKQREPHRLAALASVL